MKSKEKLEQVTKKQFIIAKDEMLQVRTIKAKHLNQVDYWKIGNPLDADWVAVIGWYNYFPSPNSNPYKMVLFRYSKEYGVAWEGKMFVCEYQSFFSNLGYNIENDTTYITEFNKLTQLFVE
jgi:hypothetical protein